MINENLLKQGGVKVNKEEQVYKMLDKVHDPELDQPLTALGFIDSTIVDHDCVEVVFRLPTYWCSPNFAFIMAEDINKYVSELDWVKEVKVNLIDHCASDEINNGVKDRKSFSESFSKLSGGDLEELRQTFQIKAFYARQEKIMKYLLKNQMSKEELITLTYDELNQLNLSNEGKRLCDHYLEKKEEYNHKTSLVFTTPEGDALIPDTFTEYLLGAKRTRLSMDIGGQYCRGLLEARYDLKAGTAE